MEGGTLAWNTQNIRGGDRVTRPERNPQHAMKLTAGQIYLILWILAMFSAAILMLTIILGEEATYHC